MTNIRIDKMLYGGAGVAVEASFESGMKSESGMTVPFVLPQELVEINLPGEPCILESSRDRVAPKCIHFGTCGGCHYQHTTYPAQFAIKQSILLDTLTNAGLTNLPVIETHSADPWHYRNRIRLRVGEVDGELRVGYNRHSATGGDPLLPITMCPIAAPVLWQAASTLLDLAKTEPAVHTWLQSAVELELFTNADETSLQLTLFTRTPPSKSFAAFCDLAQKQIPQLSGAGVALLPKKPSLQGRRFEHQKPGPQWGAAGLVYMVGVTPHWVPRGAFFQVNRYLVSTLSDLATSGRSGGIAWDLYAGVGLFSRALTRSFDQVTGVEPTATALGSLSAALKAPHRAVEMTTLEFLQIAVVHRERPSLIVMDPPRAGIGSEVCALLGRIRCPELVYVSCDPVTLARDIKHLIDSGYKLTSLHLIDMFPQTFHMETVAILQLQ